MFDAVRPSLVLVSSPGHFWLDHFVLDEARRRGIPSMCIVLSWDIFVLAGGLALVIALLTVSAQTIKAALANPVEALKYE